jgi:hypothetical protein
VSIVGSVLTLERSRVCGNTGGGISARRQSALVMRNCSLEDNTEGATVYCENVPESWIIDCVIRGNNVPSEPFNSCVSCWLSTMHLCRCVIAENSGFCGAIGYYASDYDPAPSPGLFIEDSLICGNLSCYGGPIKEIGCESPLPNARTDGLPSGRGYSPRLLVRRCTIVGNRASDNHADNLCVFPVKNAQFEDNIVVDNEGSLFYQSYMSRNQMRYCCLQEEFDGEGNFVADPLFASGPLGDYYLSCRAAGQEADSPCIDAGSTSASIAGVGNLTTRTDGAFDAGVVDIGYHYSATPPTIQASVANLTNPLVPAIAHFVPGETLSATIALENGGLPVWVDIYAGFMLPDGSIYCISPDGLTTDLIPWAATSLLPTDFVSGDVVVFEVQMPAGLPQGAYAFAAALSLTGDFRPIGDIAFCQFAVGS